MPSAAILAGGQARRLDGCDKSLLVVDGRTILDRQLTALATLTDDILLVGYRGVAPGPGVRMVLDRIPAAGPLGGLDAALAAARHEHVLVLACDMPFVSAALLQHLLAVAAAEDADVVVPRIERGYHPVCAVYARRCAVEVRRHLESRRLRLVDLFEVVSVRRVEDAELMRFGNPQRLFANVNTRGDFDALGADALKECHEP
jgi:molybdopterin-guanine dinucleotide biosynthesis protein A